MQVCVVTVCRNALAELKLTAASVESQIFPTLQYIVIDGASSDGTCAFLESVGDLIDHWISEPDRGIYDAMNKAIDYCPPDSWVVFLNAGDSFASDDVLQRLSPCLTDDVDFVFGDVAVGLPNGATRVYLARLGISSKMPGCHQSMLVRAAVLRQHRFDASYPVGADFDFYLRATRFNARVALFGGVIAEVAPEGFSAANEDLLQRDYTRAIASQRGPMRALAWLAVRKCRRAIRRTLSFVRWS